MADKDPASLPPSPGQLMIHHVTCPECGSEKAVVAATHYDEMMCFCPACEVVWDRDTPAAPRS